MNIELRCTTQCGCPVNCKKLREWANYESGRRSAAPEKDLIASYSSEWLKDGRTAIDLASRLWHYLQ